MKHGERREEKGRMGEDEEEGGGEVGVGDEGIT
jgi:hypothetical protein